jgi:hypothetical protein
VGKFRDFFKTSNGEFKPVIQPRHKSVSEDTQNFVTEFSLAEISNFECFSVI